jgi:hypothetical protein
VIDIHELWRALERAVDERDLRSGLNYAPADLRWARNPDHPFGAQLEHLLPADYRAFVTAVGYPVVGYTSYDTLGLTFLPPEPMAALSVDMPDSEEMWPEKVEGKSTVCLHAFFAGTDLSDVDGYSFGPSRETGDIVVWKVRSGMPDKELGSFTEWFGRAITGLVEHTNTFVPEPEYDDDEYPADEKPAAMDPHRLLDHSMHGRYGQPPYSAEDLDLCWVESQATYPHRYGLVHADHEWLIPLGERFKEVKPFRDGVAEVRLADFDGKHDDPWTRIRTDGSVIG